MKLTQITLSLVTLLMLSACGGSDSGTTTNTSENETPTTVNGTSVTSDNNNTTNTNDNSSDSDTSNNTNTTSNETDSTGDNSTIQNSSDTTAPIITIVGDNPLKIKQGETFTDPGATAQDDIDGIVTVTPNGSVSMDTLGIYTISYTAADKSGNKATATRTVEVEEGATVWEVSTVSQFRDALLDASANGTHDIIKLNAGTYATNSDGKGVFSFADNEEFNLSIVAAEGLTSNDVILDGNNVNQVLNFNNSEESTLTLKNIAINNGYSSEVAAIYNNQNMIVEKCKVFNNTGDGTFPSNAAGAIYIVKKIEVIDSEFLKNTNTKNNGGAIVARDAIINNSTFSENITNTYGGAISSSNLDITDSIFTKNRAGYGGAISSSDINITNSSFIENNATSNGGALHVNNVAIIANCNFSKNSARTQGGAITGASGITLINSVFYKNINSHAQKLLSTYGFSKSHLSNNLFIENEGSLHLGGVFINNIFLKNSSDLYILNNSDVYNNYIELSNIVKNGNTVITKNNKEPSDVGDVLLANDNMSLTINSPLINQGLNPSSAKYKEIIGDTIATYNLQTGESITVYEQMLELLKTDKVGNKRIHNNTIDMGAVEFGSSK